MSKKRKATVVESLTIERMASEGKCLGKHEGRVVFVPYTAPGDVVDVKLKRSRKSYGEGHVLRYRHYSELRVEPFCQHFGTCGGCKWQHIPYEQQLAYKRQQVIDQLERIARVPYPPVPPTLASEPTRYYRNKLEYTFSDQRWFTREEINSEEDLDRRALGFHMPGSFEKVLPIQHCYLQPDPSNDIRLAIDHFAKEQEMSYYNMRHHTGLLRNLMIRTTSVAATTTSEVMVMVQFGGDAAGQEDKITALMEFIRQRFPELTSLQYVINPKKNDTFHDLDVVLYHGLPYITERMEDLQFRISAQSFYQTNPTQAYRLYQTARDFAQLTGQEMVYDLYTGTGTIANFVAAQAKQVVGLEYVETAIEDARTNAQINGIRNVSFHAGDIKDLLNEDFLQQQGKPDVVITDPPRNGMHPDVVQQLLRTAAPRIVYVSCNPATQARDIALLSEKYDVSKLQPVDMFPHTHHVENVALLTLK